MRHVNRRWFVVEIMYLILNLKMIENMESIPQIQTYQNMAAHLK